MAGCSSFSDALLPPSPSSVFFPRGSPKPASFVAPSAIQLFPPPLSFQLGLPPAFNKLCLRVSNPSPLLFLFPHFLSIAPYSLPLKTRSSPPTTSAFAEHHRQVERWGTRRGRHLPGPISLGLQKLTCDPPDSPMPPEFLCPSGPLEAPGTVRGRSGGCEKGLSLARFAAILKHPHVFPILIFTPLCLPSLRLSGSGPSVLIRTFVSLRKQNPGSSVAFDVAVCLLHSLPSGFPPLLVDGGLFVALPEAHLLCILCSPPFQSRFHMSLSSMVSLLQRQ